MTALGGWENFYVIVGSSAGALIGLQFVVMALVSDMPRTPNQAQTGHAFATPTMCSLRSRVAAISGAQCSMAQHRRGRSCLGLMGLGELRMPSSPLGARQYKPHTGPSSRIGCFMLCCLSRPTQPWLHRPTRLTPIRLGPCLGSQRRRCCCSSSAFTMPGTPFLTTSL